MERIRIIGGNPLKGVIPIAGAKNAALPLMVAALLSEETLTLSNLPHVVDIATLACPITDKAEHHRRALLLAGFSRHHAQPAVALGVLVTGIARIGGTCITRRATIIAATLLSGQATAVIQQAEPHARRGSGVVRIDR